MLKMYAYKVFKEMKYMNNSVSETNITNGFCNKRFCSGNCTQALEYIYRLFHESINHKIQVSTSIKEKCRQSEGRASDQQQSHRRLGFLINKIIVG